MKRVLVVIALSSFSTAYADQRMADVAVYANSMWYAEEFNRICPESQIDVPVSEAKLRELMVTVDGRNMVDEFDELVGVPLDPSVTSMSEQQKLLAREATAEGCDSESANMLREVVEKDLEVPELLEELLEYEKELEAGD